MARDTPPSLIAYYEIPYVGGGSGSRSFTSITWLTGDVVTVVGGSEGSASGKNTGPPANQTGLAFAASAHTSGSNCSGGAWTAVATQGASAAISMPDAQEQWGATLWQWRGSDGVGQRWVTASPSSTRTVTVTPTDTHSAYVWGIYDWSTNSYTNAAFSPTQSHIREDVGNNRPGLAGGGGGWTISVADLTDMSGSTQTGFGLTATAPSSGVFTIVGAEVLGTTSGAPSLPPDLNMAPPDTR